ncbi:hypothetical protein [Ectopseudomonas alcaliphila]|nr:MULTISPECIES: hypothetical protein [Pseudomonas]MDP9939322.1 hypothetical protein [Pseudomonas sp. 3400]MDR7011544.1 hypothetical protein [Pseudomonas alcaliphila]
MGHRLDLSGTAGGIFQPGGRCVLGKQGDAPGVIVGQAFELGG